MSNNQLENLITKAETTAALDALIYAADYQQTKGIIAPFEFQSLMIKIDIKRDALLVQDHEDAILEDVVFNVNVGMHAKAMHFKKSLSTKSNDELEYISNDCKEAIKANPENPKCRQYSDTANMCDSELANRKDA